MIEAYVIEILIVNHGIPDQFLLHVGGILMSFFKIILICSKHLPIRTLSLSIGNKSTKFTL